MQAKFDKIVVPIAELILDENIAGNVVFNAFSKCYVSRGSSWFRYKKYYQ